MRVSRYIPQAYVIEGFCLGHKDFIAAIAVPEGRPEVLVSAGGDSEVFLWDWKAGKRIGGASVLDLARQVQADVKNIAVQQVVTMRWIKDGEEEEDLTFILVICEEYVYTDDPPFPTRFKHTSCS